MNTASREDYIKIIYTANAETGAPVSTSYIAGKLKVSQAAISDMMRRLSADGLVNYTKYKGALLTDAGKNIALQVLRRHRLWELFLINVLGMKWDEVHAEAERLEHETSEYLLNRIDEYLNFPEFDPHGAPIPNKDGVLPKEDELILLAETDIDENYCVKKVNDENSEMMKYLTNIGLEIGIKFRVIGKYEFDESVLIEISGKEFNLSKVLCNNIFVKKEEGTNE